MLNTVQVETLQELTPGRTISHQLWYSLPDEERSRIEAELLSRGLWLMESEEEKFFAIIHYDSSRVEAEQEESEPPPISLEQIQAILKKHLAGEVTISLGDPAGSRCCLSQKSMFRVGEFEELGTRISGVLRLIAGEFLQSADAISEANGDWPEERFYTRPGMGFCVTAYGVDDDIDIHVLNASSEADAIRQARQAIASMARDISFHPIPTACTSEATNPQRLTA